MLAFHCINIYISCKKDIVLEIYIRLFLYDMSRIKYGLRTIRFLKCDRKIIWSFNLYKGKEKGCFDG